MEKNHLELEINLLNNISLLEIVGEQDGVKMVMLESLLLKINSNKECVIYMAIIMLLLLKMKQLLIL
jgi:hypothetical protein